MSGYVDAGSVDAGSVNSAGVDVRDASACAGAESAEAGARLGQCAVEWGRERWVRTEEGRLRYREAGEGPPLVLVHGLGCSADYWVRNGPPLAAEGFRVLAMDLPGFGRTPGPRLGLPIERQAAAVEAFAQALGTGPAVFVGHSLSCQSVIELAARRPERVAGLVLAAPTGDRRRKRLLRESLGLLADVPREPPRLISLLGEAYLRAGPLRWAGTWLRGKGHDTFVAAARVAAPALVLVGGRDPVCTPPFAAALAAALPLGRCRVVDTAAHGIIYDAARAFNREVAAFADEVLRVRIRGRPTGPP